MIEHSGASYGYVAEKLRFPDDRLSVIVLCNHRDRSFIEISNRLADAFLGLKEASEEIPAAPPPTIPELTHFKGVYFSEASSDGLLLEVRNGSLFDGGSNREFRRTGPLTFKSSSRGTICRCGIEYTFFEGADGAINGFSATPSIANDLGEPQPTIYARLAAGRTTALSEYAGVYVSDEVSVAWCLLKKGDALVVRRRGFEDRPSQLVLRDVIDGPGGLLQFDRRGGRVRGFRARNDRFGSLTFRKLDGGQHAVPMPWDCG
jgi:hypothetical protein